MHLSDGEVELDALAAFLEAFSDAQYRLHAGRQYGTHLIDDVDVVFGMVLAAFGMPDDDVRAAEVRDHVSGDIAGERTLCGHRHGLRAVADLELVGFDQHLDAAQRRERRHQGYFAAGVVEACVTKQPYEFLHEIRGLKMVEVHLPIAREQRDA